MILHCNSCGVRDKHAHERRCNYCGAFTVTEYNTAGEVTQSLAGQKSPLGTGISSKGQGAPAALAMNARPPSIPLTGRPAGAGPMQVKGPSVQQRQQAQSNKESIKSGNPPENSVAALRGKLEKLDRCNITNGKCDQPAVCHQDRNGKLTRACDQHSKLIEGDKYYFPNAKDIRSWKGVLEAREAKEYHPRPVLNELDTITYDVAGVATVSEKRSN